ncbi:MAG TPA: hypothetical protein ENJ79_08130 [Gammaproteobacteria bacterium]|nr:hypothetical protein [Gammaproteobacteria bacterium]
MWKTVIEQLLKLSLLVSVCIGVQINAASAGSNDTRISLRHPALSALGFAQLNVTLNPALAPGETLEVYSNGQLAAGVKTAGFGIKRAAFHIWLVDDGAVEVRILDASGNTVATKASKIPSDAPRGKSLPPLKQTADRPSVSLLRARKNKVMFRLQHGLAPGRTGYVDLKGDSGSLTLKAKPYLYKKANITFYLDRDPGNLKLASTRSE